MINAMIKMTINAIKEDGIEEFVPVLIDFDRRDVRGLSEIPEDVDHRAAVKDWLNGMQLDNYGVALRIGDEIGIMMSSKGDKTFVMLRHAEGSWTASDAPDFFI